MKKGKRPVCSGRVDSRKINTMKITEKKTKQNNFFTLNSSVVSEGEDGVDRSPLGIFLAVMF